MSWLFWESRFLCGTDCRIVRLYLEISDYFGGIAEGYWISQLESMLHNLHIHWMYCLDSEYFGLSLSFTEKNPSISRTCDGFKGRCFDDTGAHQSFATDSNWYSWIFSLPGYLDPKKTIGLRKKGEGDLLRWCFFLCILFLLDSTNID